MLLCVLRIFVFVQFYDDNVDILSSRQRKVKFRRAKSVHISSPKTDRAGQRSASSVGIDLPLYEGSLYSAQLATYLRISLAASELSQFRPVQAKCGARCGFALRFTSLSSRVSVLTSWPAREG